MASRTWTEFKEQRRLSPDASEEYAAARYAFEIGQRVRELRKSCGWSQKELANRAEMSQPAIARFEAGGTTPTITVLDRLARAFGMTLTIDITPNSAA